MSNALLLLFVVVGYAVAGLTPGWVRAGAALRQLRAAHSDNFVPQPACGVRSRHSALAPMDSDIVVGYPDSNETRVITGPYTHQGRIIVLNNGTLVLDSADFTLRGDIYVFNHGTMRVRKGTLTIPQQFAYQYGSEVANDGRFEFDTARVRYGGFSWSVGVADSAAFAVNSCSLQLGFTTVSLTGHAQVNYSGSDFASEYVIFDSSVLHLAHCDTALVWLGFPSGSAADITLPDADTTLRHWEIHDGSPGVSGIGYTVTLDTMTGVLWGSFPQAGCSVTVRNSQMRAAGLLIPGPDSVNMSGLVNNQQQTDYTLPLADRHFRLVNTFLGSWNLYPTDSSIFVLESSVFGEMLAMGALKAVIENSICDGSGGYIGAQSTSQLFFVNSMIETQVVSRDRSLILGAGSTVEYGKVEATSASMLLWMFCNSEYDPQPLDTGIVYLSDYAVPSWAATDTAFPISGTADIQPGPYNPLKFGSYRFSWAGVDSQTTWHPIDSVHTHPVHKDTLATWNTHGLLPGAYILKMTLKNSNGDSIEPTKGVNLLYPGVAEHTKVEPREVCYLPTVVRGDLLLAPSLLSPKSSLFFKAHPYLYDIRGRKVMDLRPGRNSLRGLACGVYIVRGLQDSESSARKLIVAR
ncbi:MAG TPA: hypothetical protein VMH22_11275 [bacterium]|nr:hypothetical protein [bacterium]